MKKLRNTAAAILPTPPQTKACMMFSTAKITWSASSTTTTYASMTFCTILLSKSLQEVLLTKLHPFILATRATIAPQVLHHSRTSGADIIMNIVHTATAKDLGPISETSTLVSVCGNTDCNALCYTSPFKAPLTSAQRQFSKRLPRRGS